MLYYAKAQRVREALVGRTCMRHMRTYMGHMRTYMGHMRTFKEFVRRFARVWQEYYVYYISVYIMLYYGKTERVRGLLKPFISNP